jgi:hypothetical protein
MPSAINIITAAGTRLDVYHSATMEINMGGISLLSLSNRTITYTNEFRLPRTPTNEAAFSFSSQLSHYGYFKIAVTIQRGYFTRQAMMTYKEFGKDYACSVSYDELGTLDYIKTLNINSLDLTEARGSFTYTNAIQEMCDIPAVGTTHLFSPLVEDYFINSAYYNPNTCAIFINALIDKMDATWTDMEITGEISNAYLEKSFLFLRYAYFNSNYSGTSPYTLTQYNDNLNVAEEETAVLTVSDFLRTLAQMFFCDIRLNGKQLIFSEVSTMMGATPIVMDGFTSITKRLPTEYGLTSNIRYKVLNYEAYKDVAMDTVACPDGKGDTDLIEMDAVLPFSTHKFSIINGLWGTSTDDARKSTIIMAYDTSVTNQRAIRWSSSESWGASVTTYKAKAIDMAGLYSAVLNPIFLTPVILDASAWIDPFVANTIMDTRIIVSRQLMGKYWVDSMAYDLSTGRTKMTLIKLP